MSKKEKRKKLLKVDANLQEILTFKTLFIDDDTDTDSKQSCLSLLFLTFRILYIKTFQKQSRRKFFKID